MRAHHGSRYEMMATRRFVWLKLPSASRRVCWLGLAGFAVFAILAACSDSSTPSTPSEPSATPSRAPSPASNYAATPTITATSTDANVEVCSSGIAVPNPEDNPGLVKDCEILIRAKNVLTGASRYPLRWSASKNIHIWRDLTIGGTPPRVTGVEIFFRGLVDTAATQVDLNGSLPAELGDLTELQRLDLPHISQLG